MGLGGTAKKLQKVASMAEELYAKLNDLREQLAELRETVERTNSNVKRLQDELAENRALLEALADEQGVDVNAVTSDVSPPQSTPVGEEPSRTDPTGTDPTDPTAGTEDRSTER